MYPKPFSIYNPAVSPDVNVMSPNRTIFFLSYNGMRDGADIGKPDGGNGFQLGKVRPGRGSGVATLCSVIPQSINGA